MKNIIIRAIPFLIASISLTGCLKGLDMNIDPNNTTEDIFTMQYIAGGGGSTIGSGLTYFGGAALTYPPTDVSDTATFNVALTGGKTLDKDVTITVGADNNALLDNFKNDNITFIAMPDSVYHLISNTATIKAGSNIAQFQIVFFPSKVDPTKNFMLPITVTDTKGYQVSANYGHIYFHTIGNPIAGVYKWDYTRWNSSDGSGTATSASFVGHSTTFVPVNPTSIEVQSGYGEQNGFNYRYVLSFTNNAGVLSNFSLKMNPTDVSSVSTNSGISLSSGPTLISADPVKGEFKFSFQVYNGSANRYFEEKFYK